MNTRTVEVDGFTLHVRTDKDGDLDVIEEVIEGDCYRLRELKASGYQPSCILDIGAHIGTFALLANRYWPRVQVRCFEPNVDSYELLTRNTRDISAIWPRENVAVGYTEGMVLTDGAGTTGGGFVVTRERMEAMRAERGGAPWPYTVVRERVPVVPLDPYLIHSPNTLLKMDCEGGEIEIFENIAPAAAANVTAIVGEYHTRRGYPTWESIRALAAAKFPHLTFTARRVAPLEVFFAR